LLAHGRWFSPDTPASSTTKTGRHDIVESGAKTPKIKIKNQSAPCCHGKTITAPSPEHQQITVSGEPCFTCNAPSLRLSCQNIFPTII
jgi:hypothetical protein